jgi:hypothetical protein
MSVLTGAMCAGVMATVMLPLTLVGAASIIDNPWTIGTDRADKAGVLLATALLERQHGHRPVVLVGWSCGARLIFSCLKELASHGERGRGLVESSFLLGAPVSTNLEDWEAARTVVAHRLVNGYAPADWLLTLVHRTTQLTLGTLAGLSPVPHPGIENVNVGGVLGAKQHIRYCKRTNQIIKQMLQLESGVGIGL